MYNFYNSILLYLDKITVQKPTKFNSRLYTAFLPIFAVLECLVYRYYWKKIIIQELLTNDEIVKFLDANEFGYRFYKLYKKDILDLERVQGTTIEEMHKSIHQEFNVAFLKLFEDHINLDIENHINLVVEIDRTASGIYIYSVTLRFYRLAFVQRALIRLIYWVLLVAAIAAGIYFLPTIGHFFGLR